MLSAATVAFCGCQGLSSFKFNHRSALSMAHRCRLREVNSTAWPLFLAENLLQVLFLTPWPAFCLCHCLCQLIVFFFLSILSLERWQSVKHVEITWKKIVLCDCNVCRCERLSWRWDKRGNNRFLYLGYHSVKENLCYLKLA